MTDSVSAGEKSTSDLIGPELGGLVYRTLVVARSAKAAVVATNLNAYTDGLTFQILLMAGQPNVVGTAVEDEALALVTNRTPVSGTGAGFDLRASASRHPDSSSDSLKPMLERVGGFGGPVGARTAAVWHSSYFLSPFPTTGLVFTAWWPAAGVQRAEAELDKASLTEARARIVPLA